MKISRVTYGWVAGVVMVFAASLARAQVLPSATYYTNTINLTSASLKAALHDDIKGHTVIAYSPTRPVLAVIDRDTQTSTNLILIYSGFLLATNKFTVTGGDTGTWNREHMFPESYGMNTGIQQSDLFNLRACDTTANGIRGNLYYDTSTVPSNTTSLAPGSSYDSDSWEPRDGDKGFVARACFYVTTRYNGTGGETNLVLSDTPNSAAGTFAKLSTLLDWNRRFPPTDWERTRNGLICQNYQFNRNPFIDNPDFADMVFLGVDGFTAWQDTHFTPAELSDANISGATADPDGDGIPNLAEYALGHDPHVVEASSIQSVTNQTVGGTNFVYLVHHKNHYASGITFTYQTSADSASWTNATYEVLSTTQIDPQKDSVSVRFPADTNALYVRFKITRP
jgi:endonuclease I